MSLNDVSSTDIKFFLIHIKRFLTAHFKGLFDLYPRKRPAILNHGVHLQNRIRSIRYTYGLITGTYIPSGITQKQKKQYIPDIHLSFIYHFASPPNAIRTLTISNTSSLH